MADFTTPSSRSPQLQVEHKWTVSPEFGRALLTAMRERSNTGGPLPRLPSMLQLPSPELPTPTVSSPTKPDSTERLKMKTRVAIRDRDPHRFQVVPLRDADKYSVNQKQVSRGQAMESVSIRGVGPARANLCSWKKGYVGENDSAPLVSVLQDRPFKTDTPERLAILSERNKNIPAQELSSLGIPVALDGHGATDIQSDSRPLAEQSKQLSKQCSSLSAKTKSNHYKLHFKSPSLGNLRSKPSLDIDLKENPLPRVTSCRKRTNTLSADHKRRLDITISTEPVQQPDRRTLVKKDSVRRHAIYTQSLYVPAVERPNLSPDEISAQPSDESYPLRALPFRSSIPVNPKKFNTFPAAHTGNALTGNALGFIDMPSSAPGIQGGNVNSQSSIPSIHSQDKPTRPSTPSLDSSLHHHPIVLELLAELEKAMQEWST